MAKDSAANDNLFNDLNIEDLETGLLTVDVGENETVSQTVKEIQDDPDNNDKNKNPDVKNDKSEQQQHQEDNFINIGEESDIETEDKEDKNKSPETKETKEKGGGKPNHESDSPVYLHATDLKDSGLLPNFNLDDIKDLEPAEALTKINSHIQTQINDSIKDGIDEFKKNLAEPVQKLIDDIQSGVAFESLAENYTLEQRFGSITDKDLNDDEELQEQVYADYLSLKDFSEKKIKDMIDIAKEKDTLLADSKEGLNQINTWIKKEREDMVKSAKALEEKNKKTHEETLQKVNQHVNDTKEIIPGIILKENEKKELIKMMTVPDHYENINGRDVPLSKADTLRRKNPIQFALRLNYLINQGFFDDDLKNLKIEKFIQTNETTASKKLIDKLSSGKTPAGKPIVHEQTKKDEENEVPIRFPLGM